MKRKQKLAMLLGVLFSSLVLGGAIKAFTLQTPVIDWDVIGNGGGHLEQGDLSLDYTIGQPVAGQLSIGDTTLCAGYWCGASAKNHVYLPLVLKSERAKLH